MHLSKRTGIGFPFALTGAALVAAPLGLIVEGWPHIDFPATRPAWLWHGLFPAAMNFQIVTFLLPRNGAANFATNGLIPPLVPIGPGVTRRGPPGAPNPQAGDPLDSNS